MSGGRVFRDGENGELEFVGDFEGLYQAEDDPWGQSGEDERMGVYYRHSRHRLVEALSRHRAAIAGRPLLEVGCGLGFVTHLLREAFPDLRVEGMDISPTAIARAAARFPDLAFRLGDITADAAPSTAPHGAVVFNNLLWYILPRLRHALGNARAMLGPGGLVVVSNAFVAGTQRYGTDMVDGFRGLLRVLLDEEALGLRLIEAGYDDSPAMEHHDGLVVLRRLD